LSVSDGQRQMAVHTQTERQRERERERERLSYHYKQWVYIAKPIANITYSTHNDT